MPRELRERRANVDRSRRIVRHRQSIVAVLNVKVKPDPDLLLVRHTRRPLSRRLRLSKDREQDRRQDGDDSNNDEKLNERKSAVLHNELVKENKDSDSSI